MGRPEMRRRIEQAQGFVFDTILVAIAVAVAEDAVQEWLLHNKRALLDGLTAIHLVAMPAVLVAAMSGYGKAGRELMRNSGPNVFGWAIALLLCGSFVIPGVLSLIFKLPLWQMMLGIFGPLVAFALWVTAILVAERRGSCQPARIDVPKAWWRVQALALVTWLYLIWLETMLLVAAAREGPLVEVGIPLGVLVDYIPIRVMLYYVRETSRWELLTIALSVAHLLYRIAAA